MQSNGLTNRIIFEENNNTRIAYCSGFRAAINIQVDLKMDALMSQILTSARMKATIQETPLDLSWNTFTKNTCDSFITNKDMRREPNEDCVNEKDEQSSVTNLQHWHMLHSTPIQSSFVSGGSSVSIKKEKPHPFSIEALIGEKGGTDSENAQAQVSSSWMDDVPRHLVYNGNCDIRTQEHINIKELSPIRAVSMLKTKNVYWCHVCNSICTDKNEADHHQLIHRVHRSRCSLRRNAFNEHGYVTRHEQMDSDRLHCSLCNKVVSMCFFSKHQRLHNGHVCNVCDQEFSSNSRLQDHMNAHTGRTPFSCTICDRHFAKRSSLTQHQRYHRDHKNFECKFCHKCFNSKYACAVHERLHTGENPFKCLFQGCTRAFPQKIQLKLHINSHHRTSIRI